MINRPLTLLIAALGGEGGGLLTDWIIKAAAACDLPVQSTSIPGVAQRTGATTYYVEIFPQTNEVLAGRRPLFALSPCSGAVDVVLATELLEAARAAENGFVSPDRSTLVALVRRVFSIHEKSNTVDGRYLDAEAVRGLEQLSRNLRLIDVTKESSLHQHPSNALLLGALAGLRVLPIATEKFEQAVQASGVAVESNIAAFRAGYELSNRSEAPMDPAVLVKNVSGGQKESTRNLPMQVAAIVDAGAARVRDYQDARYVEAYRLRVDAILACDRDPFILTKETARNLALWMSYEDVIRVADLKCRAERFQAVRDDAKISLNDPAQIVEFLKPGIDEIAAVLPYAMGKTLRRWAINGNWSHKRLALRIRSTTVIGFLQLRMLASLKAIRPSSLRFREEQAGIDLWLSAIKKAAAFDLPFAIEIAHSASLVKGYGDTLARGRLNFELIFSHLIEPGIAEPTVGRAKILNAARTAALADPDGGALQRLLPTALNRTRPDAKT